MSDWKEIPKNPKESDYPSVTAGIFRVKTSDDLELDALYYQDACVWISYYGQKTSRWWAADSHERLDNVTHWKEREKSQS